MNESEEKPAPSRRRKTSPPDSAAPKRPRGRPKKNPPPSPEEPQKKSTPPPADPLPDYEIDEPKRQAHHWLLDQLADIRVRIVLGIVVLGIIGWMAAPPAYRKAKEWRALQLMEKSEAAAANGKIEDAAILMRQAILMAPGNEEVFRRVRVLNAGLGDPASLNAIANTMMDGKATPEEILVVAEQSLKSGQKTLARTAIDKLGAHPSARKTVVEIKLLDLEGRRPDALALAKNSITGLQPGDADRIRLATAEMMLVDDPSTSRGILIELSQKNNTEGIAAARILANQQLSKPRTGGLTPSKAAEILSAHALATPDDMLLAADLRIAEDPARKRAIIAELKRQRREAPDPDALAFARWLNRRMAYEDTIEFVGRGRAVGSQDWLLIYLDALAGQNNWAEVFNILDAEQVGGLSNSIRLLFLARSAAKSGEPQKAEDAWREMQQGLEFEKPEVVAFVASYAMRVGERDQAIKAYTTLSRRRETALEGYLGLIRCWPSNSPASELLPIYDEFVEAFPNISEAKTDQAYLRLLTNTSNRRTTAEALEAYKKQPNSLATISVAALGLLRTGDFAGADSLYNGKVIAWSTAPAQWKNVRAAVLHALGRNSEADELMQGVDRNALRPEERALLPEENVSAPGIAP